LPINDEIFGSYPKTLAIFTTSGKISDVTAAKFANEMVANIK